MEWYYLQNGVQHGPVEWSELFGWLAKEQSNVMISYGTRHRETSGCRRGA